MVSVNTLFQFGSYQFSTVATFWFLTGLLAFGMGLGVLFYEKSSLESRLFMLMAHLAAGWQVSYALMFASPTAAMATSWGRVAFTIIPFIFPAVYQFSTTVLRLEEKRKRAIWTAWLAGAACAGIIAGTDEIIRGAYKYDWGYFIQLDPGGVLIVGLFYFILAGAILEYSFRFQQKGVSKNYRKRARWLFYAFALTLVTIVDYFPAYGIDIIPMSPVAVISFAAIAAFVVRKHRLVDFTPSLAAGKVFETAADPIFICDLTGKIHIVNQAAQEMLGYTPGDCEGKNFVALFLRDEQDSRRVEELMAQPEVLRNQELTLRNAKDQPVPTTLSASPLTERDDEIVGSVWIARDLSEQKAQAYPRVYKPGPPDDRKESKSWAGAYRYSRKLSASDGTLPEAFVLAFRPSWPPCIRYTKLLNKYDDSRAPREALKTFGSLGSRSTYSTTEPKQKAWSLVAL